MRHDREHHRGRTSENRPNADRQLDLFGRPRKDARVSTPAWEALPAQARGELTILMTRLIVDHARSGGASVIVEARHEP
jgi:hypothetical protein